MGIRIHKCCGYGFEGDTSKFILDQNACYERDASQIPSTADLDLLTKNLTFLNFYEEINGSKAVERFDTFGIFRDDSEHLYTLETVGDYEKDSGMIFYLAKDWYRFDNIIDWLENKTDGTDKFEFINSSGIYPYELQMICDHDCASGKKHDLLNGGDYNQLVGRWSKDCEALAKGEKLESYLKDWRCCLPDELIMGVYLTKTLDNKIELLKSIKPCIATWWR